MAQKDRNDMKIERAPNSPGDIIDPRDPHAQKKFEKKQSRMYSDRVRIDPFSPGYVTRKIYKKATVKT